MNHTQPSSKWVRKIADLQHPDGSWGFFHALSEPTKTKPITTEQALRRLKVLGLTKADELIGRALDYIEKCLAGEIFIPDRREILHDWDVFTSMMFAAWLRVFDPQHTAALSVAQRWADIIAAAFSDGQYSHDKYVAAYRGQFGLTPRGGRLVDCVSFYQLALLPGVLTPQTERAVLDYVLRRAEGIYYVYGEPLNVLPEAFASRKVSRYLAALELLSEYNSASEKLGFAAQWMLDNRGADDSWDMGSGAQDGIYFPLADSWRKAEDRKRDCTSRVLRLLNTLGVKVHGYLDETVVG